MLEFYEGTKAAAQLNKQALNHGVSLIKEGVNYELVDQEVGKFIRDLGGIPHAPELGFPGNCCISVNNVAIHGVPKRKFFENADVVKLDVCSRFGKFFGDHCTTVIVGEASNYVTNFVNTVMFLTEKCIETLIPGKRFYDHTLVLSQEYYVSPDFGGHKIGDELHESYIRHHISNYNLGMIVEPHTCFTVEPLFLNKKASLIKSSDGWSHYANPLSFSAQFEHMVYIHEHGPEIL